jgi:ribonuclease PH
MLPGSTIDRKARSIGKAADGRSVEIQRLIGRALRQAVDIDQIGQKTLYIDCDVLCADGGTRTASITGAWVAVAIWLKRAKLERALLRQVAAVSLGIVGDEIFTDLNYLEDVAASTDFNLIACGDGTIVEFQGAAEIRPMQRQQMDLIVDQGLVAIKQICALQNAAVA